MCMIRSLHLPYKPLESTLSRVDLQLEISRNNPRETRFGNVT